MKKTIALLIALVLCMNFCASAFAAGDWTVFVYLCGSDLESERSLASQNMRQMIDAYTNANVRFVVQTGGAYHWDNGASSDDLDRYLVTGGRMELVDRQPLASMGDVDTLTDFLRWGLGTYPSAHVGLILWDHGSGSINGVCFDEMEDDESLLLTDIQEALSRVQSLLPGGFDFVGFDACLMGTVETAAMLAPYARYMVASEELVPGSGWDYEAMGRYMNAYPYADGADLGRAICDSYYQRCAANNRAERATLSVTDLSRIDALRTAFDAYAKDLVAATEEDADFAPIARAIAAADNFGGNNHSEGYTNMIDLGGLIAAGDSWSFHAREVRDALDSMILYQVLGPQHYRASGLSVYYPLEVQGSIELSIFKDVCISAWYLELVNKVAYGFASGGNWDEYDGSLDWDWDDTAQEYGESAAISFEAEPWVDENGTYSFILTEEALYNTESVEAMVYLIAEEEEDYICIGYTSDILEDWEYGIFEDNFDGYWFALPDGQSLCVYLVDQYDGYDVFTSPVSVNGEEKNLRFAWDYTTGEVQILDLWDGISTNGIASRPGESLKPGDRIIPLYDAYSMYSDDEISYYGAEYVWRDGDALYFELLPDGDYLYSFCINDIYGGSYVTDCVEFFIEDGDIMYDAA